MDLRRAKYILPNLFTLASVYCGISSIYLSTHATSVQEMTLAAWLLVVAMVCDAFDGRVARMTHTESEFGVQLDSLADAISFGVAPAFLLYSWGMESLGGVGLFFSFAYAACAIMRLARFNVLASQNPGVMRYFLGLPTPLATGTVVSVVLAHVSLTDRIDTQAGWSVAAMALLLGGVMVSNVRYRTFKDVKFRGRAIVGLLTIVATCAAISVLSKPSITFVMLMVAYIVLGLGGGILNLGKHVLGNSEDEADAANQLDDYLTELDEHDKDTKGV